MRKFWKPCNPLNAFVNTHKSSLGISFNQKQIYFKIYLIQKVVINLHAICFVNTAKSVLVFGIISILTKLKNEYNFTTFEEYFVKKLFYSSQVGNLTRDEVLQTRFEFEIFHLIIGNYVLQMCLRHSCRLLTILNYFNFMLRTILLFVKNDSVSNLYSLFPL